MNGMNYAGLDIHKKSISCCVRQADGTIIEESTITATRQALDEWLRLLPEPWITGMEATMFTGWIYDHLVSVGAVVKVAHPAMLQAIAAGKKKNDRVDARKIADLLRCDYFPECHMASREIRDRRRVLRYRNLLVRQAEVAVALRALPGLGAMAGKRGSADFTVTFGNVAVLGLRFSAIAFTSIPTADR